MLKHNVRLSKLCVRSLLPNPIQEITLRSDKPVYLGRPPPFLAQNARRLGHILGFLLYLSCLVFQIFIEQLLLLVPFFGFLGFP